MRETRVRSLGWKDPLEKEMATPSSILTWNIPWMEERGRLQSLGSQRVGHDLRDFTHLSCRYLSPWAFSKHSVKYSRAVFLLIKIIIVNTYCVCCLLHIILNSLHLLTYLILCTRLELGLLD